MHRGGAGYDENVRGIREVCVCSRHKRGAVYGIRFHFNKPLRAMCPLLQVQGNRTDKVTHLDIVWWERKVITVHRSLSETSSFIDGLHHSTCMLFHKVFIGSNILKVIYIHP